MLENYRLQLLITFMFDNFLQTIEESENFDLWVIVDFFYFTDNQYY